MTSCSAPGWEALEDIGLVDPDHGQHAPLSVQGVAPAGLCHCTNAVEELSDGLLAHLRARGTAFVLVSRAPLAKLEAYRVSRDWTVPWYSSYGSDFNYDFQVTLDASVPPAPG